MLSFIKRLLPSLEPAGPDPLPALPVETHDPTEAEIHAVHRSLETLTAAGLQLADQYAGMSLRDVAIEMLRASPFLAEDAATDDQGAGPTLAYFVLTQLRDGDDVQLFNNAILFQDHCYDVADPSSYSAMIEKMIGLTQGAWRADGVKMHESTLELGQPATISIASPSPVAPFSLVHNKDFDWTVVDRLNERLPTRTQGRFAAAFDGNATIVFLKPAQLEELCTVCRFAFYKSPVDKSPSREAP